MKLYKYIGLLGVAFLMGTAVGCSDDKDVVPLDKSEMAVENAAYNTLTFEWGRVDGARQYSYEFRRSDSEDIIEIGLTKDNKATFTGLDPDTEYTLTVLAYAAINSDNTTSEPIVLTARTSPLEPIEAPVLRWSREVNTVIISWDAVEGARTYEYSFVDADGNEIGSGTTFDTSVSFAKMQDGEYTFNIVAQTIAGGRTDSEESSMTFEFKRVREELWSIEGTYTSALLDKTWKATLVSYDDNSYTILNWYGVEGYDLEFTIDQSDANNMFHAGCEGVEYSYNSSTGTYSIPTGLSSPSTIGLKASGNQSAMTGNSGRGNVTLSVTDGSTSGTDRLEWGITINDFVGTWTLNFAGYDYFAYGAESDYDEFYTADVEVTLGSAANTLMVPMPNYYGYKGGTGTMVVDLDEMTFTMSPVEIGEFVISGYGIEDSNVTMTGTISMKKIVFNPIQLWWGEYYYISEDSYLNYTRE